MKLLVASLAIAGLMLFGCSTPQKVSGMQGKGPARIYNASYPQTWQAAVDSAWGLGLTVLRVYPRDGFISAKRGMTSTSLGEDVGIWVKDAGAGKTQVEVVSRQKGIPVLIVKNWEEDVFHAIGDRLGSAPIAQGGAPGASTPIRAYGSSTPQNPAAAPISLQPVPVNTVSTPAKPVITTPSQSTVPMTKDSAAQFNLTKDMLLREQLRRYLASKEADYKTETQPTRRELIQGEIDYLREELNRLDAKLSNVPK